MKATAPSFSLFEHRVRPSVGEQLRSLQRVHEESVQAAAAAKQVGHVGDVGIQMHFALSGLVQLTRYSCATIMCSPVLTSHAASCLGLSGRKCFAQSCTVCSNNMCCVGFKSCRCHALLLLLLSDPAGRQYRQLQGQHCRLEVGNRIEGPV
jgi:hypothetical protein